MSFIAVGQQLLVNKIAGSCPLLYLHCPQCKVIAEQYSLDASDCNWAVTLRCTLCGLSWTICNVCPRFREYLVTPQDVYHHDHHVHMRKKRASTTAVDLLHSHDTKTQQDDAVDDEQKTFPNLLLTNDFSFSELEEAANLLPTVDEDLLQSVLKVCRDKFYYYREQHFEKRYLLAKNVFNNEPLYSQVTQKDAEAHLALGKLLFTMTEPQQKLLLCLFQKLTPTMLGDGGSENLTSMQFVLPQTMANLRSMYIEGASSMMNTLPLTPLQTIGTGKNTHSYCSLIDSVQTFLAFGKGVEILTDGSKTFDPTQLSEHPRDCRRVREIYDAASSINCSNAQSAHPTLVSAYEIFCDDFNPTVSMITANLHGTWALHIGFLESTSDNLVREFNNRFLIALGNKGADHTAVLSRLEREIRELREGNSGIMFVACCQTIMQPIMDDWVRNADQPERRAVNGLKLGSKTNHARFGYALAIAKVGCYLPSCDECKVKIEQAVINCDPTLFNLFCPRRQCTNWSFDPRNTLLHAEPPDNFPSDEIPIGVQRLSPLVLTYPMLKNACLKAHRKVYLGQWTPVEGEVFLDFYGINANVVSGVIDNAVNCNLLTELENNPTANVQLYSDTMEDKKEHPDRYQVFQLPPVWYSGKTLQQFPEPKMHLLANIMKAVMALMETALGCCSLGRFEKLCASSTRDQILVCSQTLRLPWLNLAPFDKDGFVGYKSENWIALARYAKMMAVDILSIPDEPPIEFPSVTQQSKWNMKLNTAWLKLRGLPTDGKAKDLRERVASYLKDGDPPDVLPSSQLNSTHIARMLASCSNMVAHVLARQVNDAHTSRTEYAILRFLNDLDAIDSVIRYKRGKNKTNLTPIWHDRYTLLCLLNCPEDMRLYGSAHCYWEGRDEKVLKEAKKGFHCFSKNWTSNMHKEYNIKSCLDRVNSDDDKPSEMTTLRKQMPSLYVYENWSGVLAVIDSSSLRQPLVLVRTTNGGFGAVVYPDQFYRIHVGYVETVGFAAFFRIDFRSSDLQRVVSLVREDVSDIIIGFPKEIGGVILWAFSNSESMELCQDYNFHYGTN